MAIGILAPTAAAQANRVTRLVKDRHPGIQIIRASLDDLPAARLDDTGVHWGGQALHALDSLYVHGFAYEDPVLPPPAPPCDWSLWQASHVVAQQTNSFLFSVLTRVEAAGVRVYNPVSALMGAFDRFGMLDRLAKAGFATPPLCLTNDPAEAERFQNRHHPSVWRPVSGGAAWQLFTDKQRAHLVGRDRPPVLLAGVAEGPLLRIAVLDGVPVLCLSVAAPHRDDVEKLEGFRAVPLDTVPDVVRAGEAASSVGLRWAVVSAVDTGAGPVIYDLDPDPVLEDLPESVADALLAGLAASLSGDAAGPVYLDPDAVFERPSLLLRRMLAIQFDMEATKYATPDHPAKPPEDVDD